MMYYGYLKERQWIVEQSDDHIFKDPIFWGGEKAGGLKTPIYGYIKGGMSSTVLLSSSRFISKEFLQQVLKMDNEVESHEKQEIEIKVSIVPFDIKKGTDGSLRFLENVKYLNDETFYTRFAQFIEYKWLKL